VKKDSYTSDQVTTAFDVGTGMTVWNDIVLEPEPGLSIGSVALSDEGVFVSGGVRKQGMWLVRAYAIR